MAKYALIKDLSSYKPLILPALYSAVFSVLFVLVFSDPSLESVNLFSLQALNSILQLLMSFFVVILAMLKLVDLSPFVESLKKYDFLAQKIKYSGYFYPFIELSIAFSMLYDHFLVVFVGVIGFIIAACSTYSVISYLITKPKNSAKIKCACTGGNSQVKLGALSVVENIMLIAMSIAILF